MSPCGPSDAPKDRRHLQRNMPSSRLQRVDTPETMHRSIRGSHASARRVRRSAIRAPFIIAAETDETVFISRASAWANRGSSAERGVSSGHFHQSSRSARAHSARFGHRPIFVMSGVQNATCSLPRLSCQTGESQHSSIDAFSTSHSVLYPPQS